MDHGYESWIKHQASSIMDHGSWIMDHGSWVLDHGSWVLDHGSWVLGLGSLVMGGARIKWLCGGPAGTSDTKREEVGPVA